MTATPLRDHGLWHPTRGISFVPGPASPVMLTQSSRPMAEVSVRVNQYYTVASESIGIESEAWTEAMMQQTAVTQGAQPPSPNLSLQKLAQHEDTVVLVQPATKTNEPERKATDDPSPPVFDYKMADDLFYAAKRAPPGSKESFWSYKQYTRTAEDGSSQKVKVHYCSSKHTMERVCHQYFMNEKVLGFDLEWVADSTKRDGLKKNVSLIQLASPSRIALFHVALFDNSEDMVGPSFRSLMEDPGVTKVGVAIKGDTTRLRNYLDVHSRGLMELSNLYKLVTYSRTRQYHNINRRLVPLATQVEEYLHLPLFKGQNVRSSDWSRRLDMEQVIYSASDAYAGLHLYATLEHHRKQLDPCPPTPHHAELNLAIQLADGVKIASPDDALEASEVAPTNGGPLASSEKHLAAALEMVSIEDKDTASPVAVSKETKTSLITKEKPAPTTPATKPPERPKDSRVEVVEDRVASYRATHPQTRSSFSQLRAYYLWHCYDLSPAAVAQLVRDPPLKTITVVQYILSAVQAEKLPVDRDRLREVAGSLPQSTLWTRWPGVAGMVSTAPDS
ncbi:ribonuclease H-like protein [Xylariaceae sp. AK1471]|nr:ribonuclease H-like protein [Xylariaceae sp. AK1471]